MYLYLCTKFNKYLYLYLIKGILPQHCYHFNTLFPPCGTNFKTVYEKTLLLSYKLY